MTSLPKEFRVLFLVLLNLLGLLSATAWAGNTSELPTFIPERRLLIISTSLFVLAVMHTFLTKKFHHWSNLFPSDSIQRNTLHFFGEIEVVFGLWAALLIGIIAIFQGTDQSISYLNSMQFTEPVFVFVIMCISSTKPILQLAGDSISLVSKLLPGNSEIAFYCSALILGPLLGSIITEPAAMTLTTLILKDRYYKPQTSNTFLYATLGLLFVNISLGGTLTNYAAPPVLMVASHWNWDTPFMFTHFGWKSAAVIFISTTLTAAIFRKEFHKTKDTVLQNPNRSRVPAWLIMSHVLFMGCMVFFHKYVYFFLPLFLLFLGWFEVTKKYQFALKIRESLLVGFFLGGLVVLGGLQGWWLTPLMTKLNPLQMLLGATGLTAITDNAALTYLGTLVPTLSEQAKYALVAGAVTGGGLTVIANAPNPIGYSLLQDAFGKEGISPLCLFLSALPYTLFALTVFYITL